MVTKKNDQVTTTPDPIIAQLELAELLGERPKSAGFTTLNGGRFTKGKNEVHMDIKAGKYGLEQHIKSFEGEKVIFYTLAGTMPSDEYLEKFLGD